MQTQQDNQISYGGYNNSDIGFKFHIIVKSDCFLRSYPIGYNSSSAVKKLLNYGRLKFQSLERVLDYWIAKFGIFLKQEP